MTMPPQPHPNPRAVPYPCATGPASTQSAQLVACVAGTYVTAAPTPTCQVLRLALTYGGMRAFPGEACAAGTAPPPVPLAPLPGAAGLARLCWTAADASEYAVLVSASQRALAHPSFDYFVRRSYGTGPAAVYGYYASWPVPPPVNLTVRAWFRALLVVPPLSPPPPRSLCPQGYQCQVDYPPPSPPPPPPTPPPSPPSAFVGCYSAAAGAALAAAGAAPRDPTLTPRACADLALEFQYLYYLLLGADRCLVSNDLTTVTSGGGGPSTPPAMCATPCAGDPSTTCGGDGAYAIYRSAFQQDLADGYAPLVYTGESAGQRSGFKALSFVLRVSPGHDGPVPALSKLMLPVTPAGWRKASDPVIIAGAARSLVWDKKGDGRLLLAVNKLVALDAASLSGAGVDVVIEVPAALSVGTFLSAPGVFALFSADRTLCPVGRVEGLPAAEGVSV
ncbi:hypothetical protein FOA52_010715 [Chlamydomonas sp. UWO 241]|nr:hypothetical protein FOA52_010715 [Chlamydomonas sp. UWO 241]